MLVLTRKQGEVIHVGDGITVKVIKTGKGTVKIGIDAPAHVKVLRGELAAKDDQSREKAALFEKSGSRSVAVDFTGYFPLPQTA